MNDKQLITEWYMGQRRNQERSQNIAGAKWKWKHNTKNLLGDIESNPTGVIHSSKNIH